MSRGIAELCGATERVHVSEAPLRNANLYKSETYSLLKTYSGVRPHTVYALSNGAWGLPDVKVPEFLKRYALEHEKYSFGLVSLKTEVHPYLLDIDQTELASSLGGPIVVLSMIMDSFERLMTGKGVSIGRVALEHRKQERFHIVYPDCFVDRFVGVEVRKQHLEVLSRDHPGIDWGAIVDESVLKANGLRLLGSFKYSSQKDATGRDVKRVSKGGKEYLVRKLDEGGGFYVPCSLDRVEMVLRDEKIDEEALLVRSLSTPDRTGADIVKGFPVSEPSRMPTEASVVEQASSLQDDEISKLLRILSPERWRERSSWRDIAIVLQNISGEEHKEAWIYLSAQHAPEKFTGVEAEGAQWDTFVNGNHDGPSLKVGSLRMWAREDDPEGYDRIFYRPRFRKMIVETPSADAPYACMFRDDTWGRYVSCAKDMYEYTGHRYTRVDDFVMKMRIEEVCERELKHLATVINEDIVEIDAKGKNVSADLKKKREELVNAYKAVRSGFAYIRRDGHLGSILNSLRNKLHNPDLDEELDGDPYLMGFENGVMDLRTCELRRGRPDDLITMSTGYPYFDEYNPREESAMDSFGTFIKSVYPIPEEREALQKYAGYCLLGIHNEKKFALFTDVCDGSNGKSTFARLLCRTLGEYACQPKAGFLYKKDFVRDENEHSQGMLSYRHFRLLVIEELDPTKHLDEGLLKMLNGGGCDNRGRVCGSQITKTFPWITKMILCCNEGDMPNFDATDRPLLDRMYCVPHRSKFYSIPAELERALGAGKQLSFAADSNLTDKFKMWRPYMMWWCLSGLAKYYRDKFSVIPESFYEYRDAAVAERDVINRFLTRNTVKTGDAEDYVVRADLYFDFGNDNREMQQDRKTKVGKGKFLKGMKTFFGTENYAVEHNHRHDVFFGFKTREHAA